MKASFSWSWSNLLALRLVLSNKFCFCENNFSTLGELPRGLVCNLARFSADHSGLTSSPMQATS